MQLGKLYALAEQENIPILSYPLPYTGSLSHMDGQGNTYVGMDISVQDNGALELTHLAHELGHCCTGSFYNIHAAHDTRLRHEHRADKWAIRQLITPEGLDEAVANGCTEIWQLAEYFGVTEGFIRKAVCWYVHGNLATELYF